MNIVLGYDTICGHIRLGHRYGDCVDWLFQHGMFRVDEQVKRNDGITRCLIQEKGFKISIHLIKNLQISVQCSLPMVLYGDNYYLADTIQAEEAIKKVSRRIGMDFSEFNLHRLDTTVTLPVAYDNHEVRRIIRSPKHHNKFREELNGVYFGTGSARSKSHARVLTYYNKKKAQEHEGVLRAEARIKSATKLKSFIKHDPKIGSVIQESFFLSSVNYLKQVIQESVRMYRTKEYAQEILSSLNEVYHSFSIDRRMAELYQAHLRSIEA